MFCLDHFMIDQVNDKNYSTNLLNFQPFFRLENYVQLQLALIII
jgi:hypothetical protein